MRPFETRVESLSNAARPPTASSYFLSIGSTSGATDTFSGPSTEPAPASAADFPSAPSSPARPTTAKGSAFCAVIIPSADSSCGSRPARSCRRLSATGTFGVTPCPSMSVPLAVTKSAKAYWRMAPVGSSFAAEGSVAPALRWPTTAARPEACNPPAKTSPADCVSASTSTTTGPR
jgi:hypothetical protein